MSSYTKPYEEKMTGATRHLEKELAAIRAGRANPAVLDKITVEYYGTPTQISAVAQVTTPDARTLAIQPWDATTLKAIEKAILKKADLRADALTKDHADWVESFIGEYEFNEENTMDILKSEVGKVFATVLEHAGVYKRTDEGMAAFIRFVESV